MICLRCGWCCQYLTVVLPDGTYKINGPCKFLKWKGDMAVCTIHGKRWKIVDDHGNVHEGNWDETPCGQHGQVESKNSSCRMGQYIKRR